MQVVHDNTGVTHAVLGKGQTIDFQASTSAQVLFLLSTGLYKYPRLAAAREIICNGWDAHIKSGIRDQPMAITINESGMLSVRDYGTGIPHELIGPIYCTAGDSTKVESDDETGGFGLGSKAPFAYKDHFTVISYNGGVRTMYAMAMSDSQSMGKPTAKVLHSSPTTETGIDVRVQLKPEDIDSFEKIIRRVVYLGDINATFNGEPMSVCGMDAAGTDVSILRKKYDGDMYINLQLGVRYGAVVYPLEIGDDFRAEFVSLIDTIKRRFGGLGNSMLVLRAKPNSISMVPSREALLYNPRTTKTVIELLTMAQDRLMEAANEDHRDHVASIIARAAACGWGPADMMNWNDHNDWPEVSTGNSATRMALYMAGHSSVMPMPEGQRELTFKADNMLDEVGNAHTPSEYALWYVVNNYTQVMKNKCVKNFYKKRLYEIATKFGDFNPRVARLVSRNEKIRRERTHRHIVRTYVNKPYLRATKGLVKNPDKRLYAFDTVSPRCSGNWVNSSHRAFHIGQMDKSVFNAFPNKASAIIDLGKPAIMLAWDAKDADWYTKDQINRNVHSPRRAFMYVLKLNRGSEDPNVIARALHANGFAVYDITERHGDAIDRMKEERRAEAAARRAKVLIEKEAGIAKEKRVTKETITSLSNAIQGDKSINLDLWQKVQKPVLIDNPVAIMIRTADSKRTKSWGWLDENVTKWLVKTYGDKIGITNREATAKRFIDAGAKPMLKFINELVYHELDTNPRIHTYFAEKLGMEGKYIHNDYYTRHIFEDMLEVPVFRERLGLTGLTKHEEMIANLYQNMHTNYGRFGFDKKKYPMPAASNQTDVLKRFNAAKLKSPSMMSHLHRISKAKTYHPDAQKDLTDFLFTVTNL